MSLILLHYDNETLLHFTCNLSVYLTLLWPAGHICPTYKESFQVCWDNSIAHSIFCTQLFRGKMHSDWFNRIEILQGRWQHGEKVGYRYPSGLEKTLCKWGIYVLLVTKGLTWWWIINSEICSTYWEYKGVLD